MHVINRGAMIAQSHLQIKSDACNRAITINDNVPTFLFQLYY
jgi:hypothetical protein